MNDTEAYEALNNLTNKIENPAIKCVLYTLLGCIDNNELLSLIKYLHPYLLAIRNKNQFSSN